MICDIDVLKQLLSTKGYPNAAEHAESVRWKLVQAKYYARLAEENDIEGILARSKGNVLYSNDPEFVHGLLICDAHTTCVSQILHSTADITGQMINESLLTRQSKKIQRKVFYSYDVLKELIDEGSPDCISIGNMLKDIIESDAFRYLAAFVNTVKHKRLIVSDYGFAFKVGEPLKEGVRFKRFDYKDDPYPETYAEKIYQIYLQEIEKKVCNLVDTLIKVMQ